MNRKEILNKLSDHKNFIFLMMCLGVHLLNVLFFGILRLYPLMIINIVSSIFYLCVFALYEKESDEEIILTYFEIVIFSFTSDLSVGGIYNYNYFIVGMVAVIYFLLSEKAKHRHLIQAVGALVAIADYICVTKNVCIFPETAISGIQYRIVFGLYNLFITIFTLVYVSGLYLVELSSSREKLKFACNHDMLTGLYNRRFFESALHRSHMENNSVYSIAMFDIDNFKKVNDTYGHDAGDRVLEAVSKCIGENTRKDDLAIRWGGEEFVIYMPLTELPDARKTVENICAKIRETEIKTSKCEFIKVTVTAGIQCGQKLGDYENVIKEADNRLYKGKNSGKNCIICE